MHQDSKPQYVVSPSILFGVMMKSLTGSVTPETILSTAEKVWHWATTTAANHERDAPGPAKRNGMITDKQHNRLFAIAKEHGYSNETLKMFLRQHFGIESTASIMRHQYDTICDALQVAPYYDDNIPF